MTDYSVQETLREKLPYVIEVNRLNTIANNHRLAGHMGSYNEAIMCLFDNLIIVVKEKVAIKIKNLSKTMNKELDDYDKGVSDRNPIARLTQGHDKDTIIKKYTRQMQGIIIEALDKVNLLVSHRTIAMGFEEPIKKKPTAKTE